MMLSAAVRWLCMTPFAALVLYLIFDILPRRLHAHYPTPPLLTTPGHEPSQVLAYTHADDFLPFFASVLASPYLPLADASAACAVAADGDPDVNYQFTSDADWIQRQRSDAELSRKQREWRRFVETGMVPYDRVDGSAAAEDGIDTGSAAQPRFAGRGIVVLAGGKLHRTEERVKVLLRTLLQLNSSLPVELHYWDTELTPPDREALAAVHPRVSFNDLSLPHNVVPTHAPGFAEMGYHLKTAAVLNSRFAEVLLLDSDNVPAADPAPLFASVAYARYGTVFWPDIARTRPENPMWAITSTPCRADEWEQESGQLLVDKRRFWYHLQLAAHFGHDAYYQAFLLGDKDMFRFAWHALRTPYGRPRRWLTSVGVAQPHDPAVSQARLKSLLGDEDLLKAARTAPPHYCGHSFAQHHPDTGAVAFVHGGLLKTMDLDVARFDRATGGLFRSYKYSAVAEDPTRSTRVGIKYDDGAYVDPEYSPKSIGQCTDFWDVEPRNLDEILPGFEERLEKAGAFWMLE